MTAEEILFDTEVAMEKSVDYMVHEFSSVRTGKASPALVENVDVEAYGSAMKLKQLALPLRYECIINFPLFPCRLLLFAGTYLLAALDATH